jgi:putative nucleotidyltransferase with HDIG domain
MRIYPTEIKASTMMADHYSWKDGASNHGPRLKRSIWRRLATMNYLKDKEFAHARTGSREDSTSWQNQREFPLPPLEVREMNRILSADPVDLTQIGAKAECHPLLTARVLRLCQSSLFDLPEPVSRLEHAVILAGADNVRTLLLADAAMDYAVRHLPATVSQEFWWHSLLVAQLSTQISRWMGTLYQEQAYLAGLLHDIGALPLLVAAVQNSDPVQAPLQWIDDAPENPRLHLGSDHCELGQKIGEEWDFPPALVEVFAQHHSAPGHSEFPPLVKAVAVAESVCQYAGTGHASASESQAAGSRRKIQQIVSDHFPDLGPDASFYLAQALMREVQTSGEALKEKVLAGPAV